MSADHDTRETTLDAFRAQTDEPEPEPEPEPESEPVDDLGGARYRGGTPADERGPDLAHPPDQCQNCGGHVSSTFRRLAGQETPRGNIAWACLNCVDAAVIRNAGGADPTYPLDDDRPAQKSYLRTRRDRA